MSIQAIDIQVFGRSLKVNCPLEQIEALNKAANDLNQRLQLLKERTKVTNIEQLIFIAALNISYELTQEKAKNKDYAINIEQRIKTLQRIIEQSLLNNSDFFKEAITEKI